MSRLWIVFFVLLSTTDVAAQPLTRVMSGYAATSALADPFTDHAKKLGYKEIADIATLGLEFPFVGIVTKKTFIKQQPDVVQRFVRAYTESIGLYKTIVNWRSR